MELLEKVIPYLEVFRNLVLKASDLVSVAFELNSVNVYLVLMFIISVFSAKYILEFFYTTLEGRKSHWLILTLVFFWILKMVGI